MSISVPFGAVIVVDGVTGLQSGPAYSGPGAIQTAVTNANAGDTIRIGEGFFTGNVVVDKSLSFESVSGRGSTFVIGESGVGALGAITVENGVNDVSITGITVVGVDNGAPAIENAAIYLKGPQNGFELRDSEIVANGDAGLVSEFGGALTNAVIDGNIFSGQTFIGPNPAGVGFGAQFTTSNVPRQLVVIGEGGSGPYISSNIAFTNNTVSGVTGGISSDDGVSEQGNTLVTIDVDGAIIEGNDFTGTTAGGGNALRARGPNTDIQNNSFDNSLGGDTRGVFVDDKGAPGSYAGNSFTGGAEGDLFRMSPGADVASGGAGDDSLFGALGDDSLDGGSGLGDVAIYLGSRADYVVSQTAPGTYTVTDVNGDEGVDTLTGIERVVFLGGDPAIELDANSPDYSGAFTRFEQGFEDGGFDGFSDQTNGWTGAITVLPSGEDSIVSPEGGFHARFEQTSFAGLSGPFSRLGGYSADFREGWITSARIYLAPDLFAAGEGFDVSHATMTSSGGFLRDFIFHVTEDSSTGDLLVGASNNTNNNPREDLETLNHAVIGQTGWHEFEWKFYENELGDLEVALNVYDPNGDWIFTEIRSDPGDDVGAVAGGNRYMWFTNIDVAAGILVDDVSLATLDANPVQLIRGGIIVETFATIADAVAAAAAGDVIDLADGDYSAESPVLVTVEDLTIQGGAGATGVSVELDAAIVSFSLGGDLVAPIADNDLGNAIAGSDAANDIGLGLGDDTVTGGLGDDTLDGGADSDTAVYAGNRADFTLAPTIVDGAIVSVVVTDDNAADDDEGADTLTAIETIEFADATVALDGPVIALDEFGALIGTFATIQAGVNAAPDGGSVLVAAGTYVENVTVDKQLTILGANAGVTAHDGAGLNAARGPEAVVTGGFRVDADGVTIDGFEVAGGPEAVRAASGGQSIDDLTIANLYIHDTTDSPIRFGLGFGGGLDSGNWSITGNLIDGIAGDARTGMVLFNVDGLTVSDNILLHDDVARTGRRGFNLDGVRNAEISENVLDFGDVANTSWAIQLGMSDQSISNIVVDGNSVANVSLGIFTLSQRSATDVQITDNALSAVTNGIVLNSGSAPPAEPQPSQSQIIVTGNTVDAVSNAIFLRDIHASNPDGPTTFEDVDVSNNTITSGIVRLGGTDALGGELLNIAGTVSVEGSAQNDRFEVEGAAFEADGLGGDDIFNGGAGNDTLNGGEGSDTAIYAGNRADYTVTVETDVNGAPVSFLSVVDDIIGDGDEGADALSSIETLVFADITLTLGGAVQAFDAGGLFIGAFATIQEAVDFAPAGGSVFVGAGTYPEAVTLTKPVTITGAGVDQVFVTPPAGSGFTIASDITAAAALAAVDSRIAIEGLTVSEASGSGVNFTNAATLDELVISGAAFERNDDNGVRIGGTAAPVALGSVLIEDSTFLGNGQPQASSGDGDILLFQFFGDATLRNLQITGENRDLGPAENAIQLRGDVGAIGTVLIDNVVIDGVYEKQPLGVFNYDDLSGLTMTGVVISADSTSFQLAANFDGIGGAYAISGLDASGAPDPVALQGDGTDNDLTAGDDATFLRGGDGADTLTGGLGDDTLAGQAGENSLSGGDGADSLIGGDEADALDGGTGVDTMTGGLGDDDYFVDDFFDVVVENPGEGLDRAFISETWFMAANVEQLFMQGSGNINTRGNALANVIEGNSGNNRFNGLNGDDTLFGGDGNDTINGGGQNDDMDGGDGIDTLSFEGTSGPVFASLIQTGFITTGNAGIDRYVNFENMIGSNFNDNLTGDNGDNVIDGGLGDDRLLGNGGQDTLIGGGGNDIFVFNGFSESTVAAPDVIQGFDNPGAVFGDRIDVSALDADFGVAGNQAFTFGLVGRGGLWVTNDGTDTLVFADAFGGGAPDIAIRIIDGAVNASAYTAADFIL